LPRIVGSAANLNQHVGVRGWNSRSGGLVIVVTVILLSVSLQMDTFAVWSRIPRWRRRST
jgi:hypothetical protein